MPIHPRQSDARADEKLSRGDVPPPVVVMSPPGRQTVWWVMTVVLAVIATALVTRRDGARLMKAALAQSGGSGEAGQVGARGIYAFTGQLTSKSYGVFMVDVDTGTIWCYEMAKGANNELQMRLVAARSWVFDRYLEEFNVAEPVPAAVRAIVRQQRSHREETEVEIENNAENGNVPALPNEGGSH